MPASTLESTSSEKCPRCGARISISGLSIRQIVVSAVFGGLLLIVAIPAGTLVEHWMEDACHRFADRMLWHEPLDSWDY